MDKHPAVYVVDDDPVQLLFLGGILRSAGNRAEAFGDAESLLSRLGKHARGCVVMDLQMPGLNGLDLQRALIERGACMPIIFVSGRAGVPSVVMAMKRGAIDFLSKPVDVTALCAMVEIGLKRDAGDAACRAARARSQERWSALSAREREVAKLFAKGLSNKQIAATLGIAEGTVQAQRAKALARLQVSTSGEVAGLLAEVGDG